MQNPQAGQSEACAPQRTKRGLRIDRIFFQTGCRSAEGWFVDLNSETIQRQWRRRLALGGV
jgi:hypothetical protein